MKNISVKSLALVLLMSSNSAFSENIVAEFLEGEASGSLRLRAEQVDVDIPAPLAKEDGAFATTLRTRLAYVTKGMNGFNLAAEFEDVRAVLNADDYNVPPGFSGGDPDYAVIADPASTELNEAYLGYTKGDVVVKTGRQRIVYDDARFVGDVAWRQDDQTFDALRVDYKKEALFLSAAYIDQVNGILGDENQIDKADVLANGSYTFADVGKLSGYSYMLDNEDADITQDTYGLRFAGKYASEVPLTYALEFATQTQELPASVEFDADYTLLELGTIFSGVTAAIGSETLGSDDGLYGFSTDLATKHAFNGWADLFLATPATGLVDTYIKVSGTVSGVKLLGVFHDYTADESTPVLDDLGSEINLIATKKLANGMDVGAKLAAYSADDFGSDTNKAWIWTQASF